MSEVTIAGHLLDIFRRMTPANDLHIPLRHQRADRAAGRTDRCRALSSPTDLRASCAAGGRARSRRARAANSFARRFKQLDQGRGDSPVSEADIAVNDLLREQLRGDAGDGWLSEESEDDPARLRCSRSLDRRSDRRHARLSSPAARTGRCRWRWSRMAGRCSRRCSRR